MRFDNADELKGAEFVDVNLAGAQFRNVDLGGAHFSNVNLAGAKVMEAMLVGARFSGLIEGLVINDIEVAPLIRAEMDRRYPERTKLRPTDATGAREAWSVIEGLWTATKERASALPEATLHERVDGEWSCCETFRHLVMVTDAWISGTVLGRSGHFHPIGVVPSFISEADAVEMGIEVEADPPFAEVVVAREDRMRVVRELLDGLHDDDLQRRCGDHTLQRCLHTVLDEEWHHNWFANRDLDALARQSGSSIR